MYLFTSLVGAPECGIGNDKIDEATSVKVEILDVWTSGCIFKNKIMGNNHYANKT